MYQMAVLAWWVVFDELEVTPIANSHHFIYWYKQV